MAGKAFEVGIHRASINQRRVLLFTNKRRGGGYASDRETKWHEALALGDEAVGTCGRRGAPEVVFVQIGDHAIGDPCDLAYYVSQMSTSHL